MFTVYGLNGRVYSGSLDGVRELAPVQAVARVRAAAAIGRNEQALLPSIVRGLPVPGNDYGRLGRGGERAPRQALAAYAQTQQGPAERQALSVVQELMSREVLAVPVAASVAEAWSLLAQRGYGQAPVLDARQRLVGLISRADLLPLRAFDTPEVFDPQLWKDRLALPVAALMWTPIPSAHVDTPLREVAQLLLELRLPGLPVVGEGGSVEGFLSRSDLLRAITRQPPLDLWS